MLLRFSQTEHNPSGNVKQRDDVHSLALAFVLTELRPDFALLDSDLVTLKVRVNLLELSENLPSASFLLFLDHSGQVCQFLLHQI